MKLYAEMGTGLSFHLHTEGADFGRNAMGSMRSVILLCRWDEVDSDQITTRASAFCKSPLGNNAREWSKWSK
jgi:hypothetical protein